MHRLCTIKYELVLAEAPFSAESATAVGLNSNVQVGREVLHVQTEDLGRSHPAIVTHVFSPNGQVKRVVRFDYGKHVDHPSLRNILPRAMQLQHATVIRQLQAEAGELDQPPPETTPPPCLLDAPPSEEAAAPRLECVHQDVEPSLWDRLLAKVQRERGLRKTSNMLAIRNVEETPAPEEVAQGALPRGELGKEHSWDAAVQRVRRESAEYTIPPSIAEAATSERDEEESRAAYEEGRELLRVGRTEQALVKWARAVELAPGAKRYRSALLGLLSRMEEG